jgi:hypothetical protein
MASVSCTYTIRAGTAQDGTRGGSVILSGDAAGRREKSFHGSGLNPSEDPVAWAAWAAWRDSGYVTTSGTVTVSTS